MARVDAIRDVGREHNALCAPVEAPLQVSPEGVRAALDGL